MRKTIEFVLPTFVDSKEVCVNFQGAAAGMIGTFDFEAFAVVDAAGDVEDHGDIEEVGAGESEAVVAVGLGEMGCLVVIVCVSQIVIGF
jgi:hypothetical protein